MSCSSPPPLTNILQCPVLPLLLLLPLLKRCPANHSSYLEALQRSQLVVQASQLLLIVLLIPLLPHLTLGEDLRRARRRRGLPLLPGGPAEAATGQQEEGQHQH